MEELKFNNKEEYYDIESLITDGIDARIPITIDFPDGKKAKALIKPILAEDLKIISFNTNEPFELMTGILKISLFNSNGEQLPDNLIDRLPAGLPAKIVEQIFKISGIETNPEDADK